MSLHAKRQNIAATHQRPTTVPGGSTTLAPLGTIYISLPSISYALHGEEFDSSPTAEFEIIYNPDVDLQGGDLLDFLGHRHEVTLVRGFVTGKRTDYAEADVVRKEDLEGV